MLSFAVVVKGPLLPFTRSLLTFYLNELFAARSDIGVVFSHNNASACRDTIDFLEQLSAGHPHTFAWVLAPPPPRLGYGYRNAQREAVAHGVSLAVRRWHVEFLLVQRPDSAFQRTNTLDGMAAVMRRAPPPVGGSAWGRIGICPFQTQLTDAYGAYHLDDHCMFGGSEAVSHFWSSHNPFYDRTAAVSTTLPPGGRGRACPVPGPESENGNLWVMWAASAGVAPPGTTLALLEQRAVVLNPVAWGYVSLRNHPYRFKEQTLPLSTRTFGFRTRSPLTTLQKCEAKAATYDCSALPLSENFNQTQTPAWPCSDPDVVGATKWGSLCARKANGTHAYSPSHAAAISAALS